MGWSDVSAQSSFVTNLRKSWLGCLREVEAAVLESASQQTERGVWQASKVNGKHAVEGSEHQLWEL
jgi:hypothetical protein